MRVSSLLLTRHTCTEGQPERKSGCSFAAYVHGWAFRLIDCRSSAQARASTPPTTLARLHRNSPANGKKTSNRCQVSLPYDQVRGRGARLTLGYLPQSHSMTSMLRRLSKRGSRPSRHSFNLGTSRSGTQLPQRSSLRWKTTLR